MSAAEVNVTAHVKVQWSVRWWASASDTGPFFTEPSTEARARELLPIYTASPHMSNVGLVRRESYWVPASEWEAVS